MKIQRKPMRIFRIASILTLLMGAVSCIGDQNDQIAISFDSMFPATPYKDALGSCMQVLGYLDQLCHERERGEQAGVSLVHDAFVGKVVHAQVKVTRLIVLIESGVTVDPDNMNYLSAIVGYIKQLYQDRIENDYRNASAIHMLNDINTQIARIIEHENMR